MANKQLNAVITIGGTVTGALKSAIGSTQSKLRGLGKTVRDLEREQRGLGKSMHDAMRNNRPIGDMHRRYQALTVEIAKARREQERMNRTAQGMEAGKAKMGAALGTIGAVGAVAATAGLPIVQAASFEKAMLGVAKQVKGARDENGKLTQVYWDMRKQIQLLGREIPIATNDLAAMAAAGARMGVANDDLIQFVRVASQMSTAFELPADQLADDMGKIAGLYKIPIPAIGALADAVNYLDDNAISKGSDIIEFLTRTGGVAGAVKVTGTEMAALGSTLLTLGERGETASTATNAMFTKFAAATKGTKKFRGALDTLGLSAEKIQKGMQIDAQGTVLEVLEAVNRLPKDQRMGVLADMIGLEHSDTIAKLAGNVGEYRKQIGLVNSQGVKGSMGREFAAQLATTNAQWEITKNRVREIGVNIGTVLLPHVNSFLGVIGKASGGLADFAEAHPVLVKNIAIVGGVVAGSLAGWAALTFAVGAAQTAFWGLAAAVIANPIGLTIVAIAAGAALIYANWEPIKAWFMQLWNGIGLTARVAWEGIKSAFLNATPLGLVIKNWGPLSNYFSNLFAGIKATIGSAIDWAVNKIAAVGNAWKTAKGWFGGGPGAPSTGGAPGRAPPAPPRPPAHRSAMAGGGQSNTFHITQQPGQSGRALADDVARRLAAQDRMRRGSALYDKPQGA